MTSTIYVQALPDGTFIDRGRHGPARCGGAVWYRGEAEKVIALVLRHTQERSPT